VGREILLYVKTHFHKELEFLRGEQSLQELVASIYREPEANRLKREIDAG